jgi:protein-disulfide isomerase
MRNISLFMRLGILAAALSTGTVGAQTSAAPAKKTAFDKPTLEAYLRRMQLWIPEIQVKIDDPKPAPFPQFKMVDVHISYGAATKDYLYYVSNDGQQVVEGSVHDINQNPFKLELDKIKTDLEPSFGAPGAPVVLVVFSDFQCPLCREEAKTLREKIPSVFPNEVRVYFKDFPLEAIHPWAKMASIAGRCVFRQNPEVFWGYHDWMYEHQGEITAENLKSKVLEFGKEKSLDTLQLSRCMDNKSTEGEVDKEIANGRALQIDATPTIFLNGRRLVGNTPWQNLEQIIRVELGYQKTAKDAGEKCCEVTIPSPLSKP